jgi:hypothetical protein
MCVDLCVIYEDDEQTKALVFIDERLVYRGRVPEELWAYIETIREAFEGLSRTSTCEVTQPTPSRLGA